MAFAHEAFPPEIQSLLQLHHERALRRLEQWIAQEEHFATALLQQAAAVPLPSELRHSSVDTDEIPPQEPIPAYVPVQGVQGGLMQNPTTVAQQALHQEALISETKPVKLGSNAEGAEAMTQVQACDNQSKPIEEDFNEYVLDDGTASQDVRQADGPTRAKPALAQSRSSLLSKETPRRERSRAVSFSESEIAEISLWDTEEGNDWAEEVFKSKTTMKKSKSVLEISGGRIQQVCGDITASSWFEVASAVAVSLHALLMGVEVEITARMGFNKIPLTLQIADYMFAAWFAVELGIRIAGYGCHIMRSRQRGWLLFDAVLVASSLVDLVAGSFTDVVETAFLNVARTMRILRITRLIRVLRVVRFIRFIRALRIMVYSIVSTLKTVAWAVVLLFLVIYFFAIIFTQVMSAHRYSQPFPSQDEPCPSTVSAGCHFWGSLGTSMLTLLESVIGGVDWKDPLEPLASIHWLWLTTFVVFILFTYFAILNVVTAAFCQGAIEGQQYDRDKTVQDLITNKRSDLHKASDLFVNLFSKLDMDGSGDVTWDEFRSHLTDDSMQALLALLELNDADLWVLFQMLDSNQSKCVDIREFVSGCMRLRGPARSIDLAKIACDQKMLMKRMFDLMRFVKGEISQIRSSQQAMSESSHMLFRSGSMVPMEEALRYG